ncbi:MAG: domain S-box protein, partial [Planctomycetaceae bacterium]|nr:domain S-box protein [Planctomycetaceae bacterium]
GYELARRVRREPTFEAVTLVALTGHAEDEDRQQSKAAGFDYHLVKPVSIEALQDLLKNFHRNVNKPT